MAKASSVPPSLPPPLQQKKSNRRNFLPSTWNLLRDASVDFPGSGNICFWMCSCRKNDLAQYCRKITHRDFYWMHQLGRLKMQALNHVNEDMRSELWWMQTLAGNWFYLGRERTNLPLICSEIERSFFHGVGLGRVTFALTLQFCVNVSWTTGRKDRISH